MAGRPDSEATTSVLTGSAPLPTARSAPRPDTQRHSFTAPALFPAMAPETAFGPVSILHAAELFSIVPVAFPATPPTVPPPERLPRAKQL